jgi:hypothetical protein
VGTVTSYLNLSPAFATYQENVSTCLTTRRLSVFSFVHLRDAQVGSFKSARKVHGPGPIRLEAASEGLSMGATSV